jgi:hypothetical protein
MAKRKIVVGVDGETSSFSNFSHEISRGVTEEKTSVFRQIVANTRHLLSLPLSIGPLFIGRKKAASSFEKISHEEPSSVICPHFLARSVFVVVDDDK